MATTPRRTVDYRIAPFDLHLFSAVIAHGTNTASADLILTRLGELAA